MDEARHCQGIRKSREWHDIVTVGDSRVTQARIQGEDAGAGVHPWDGRTRAEGAGSLVSRAERRDTGVS